MRWPLTAGTAALGAFVGLLVPAVLAQVPNTTPAPAKQVQAVEIWEKPIAPGLVYRMEYDPGRPMVMNALRWSLKAPGVQAKPALAGGTVYEEGPTKGRGTVSEMVASEHAIAGINGDFFPFTGHPLGLTVRDGELLSLPRPGRASFAWGPRDAMIGMAHFTGSIYDANGGPAPETAATGSSQNANAGAGSSAGRRKSGVTIPITGLNEECPENGLVLNTSSAGEALAAKLPALTAVLNVGNASFAPSTGFAAKVEYLLPDSTKTVAKQGDVLLVAQGDKIPLLASLKPGETVLVRYQVDGYDWEKLEQCVGGGPVLIRDGKIAIDDERFDSAFVDKTHPRSAVGLTGAGEIWWVTIDGRQETGSGVTLAQLAAEMLKLGCTQAMNLDGGGSTTLNVLGVTVNRPSDGTERPVADGVLIYGPAPKLSDVQLHLVTPTVADVNTESQIEVRDAGRRRVPNREVVWGAQGAAWIDQGGLLRPLRPGIAHISAAVRGVILTADITVTK